MDSTEQLARNVESLPLKFPDPQELTDTYLWAPGCAVNVKLRFQDLKFKRLVESVDGFELWLEDESENHGFPVLPTVLEELSVALGVSFEELPDGPVGRDTLLEIVKRAQPQPRFVFVDKSRWQHEWHGTGPARIHPVTVELASISAPERVTSIGIEHPSLDCVKSAHEAFGLERELTRISYLNAIAVWGDGGKVGGAG